MGPALVWLLAAIDALIWTVRRIGILASHLNDSELIRGSLDLRMRYYAAFVGWLRYILFEAGLNNYYLHKLTG